MTTASRWAYVAALAPIIFGTTYLLTSEFLPPGRPLLAALMRSLPTGLVLIVGSRPPDRQWLRRFAVLSVLYASGLFPLLFLAAYLLPGGVASVINSLSPLLVVVLSVPLLGSKITIGPGGRRHPRRGRRGHAGAPLLRPARPARTAGHDRRRHHDGRRHRADQALGPAAGDELDRDDRLDVPARRAHAAAGHADLRGPAPGADRPATSAAWSTWC